MKIGMIGLSEGNGHPFSFSSIINGYSDSGMRRSGWAGIYAYLKKRKAAEFGFPGVSVTHAWTQDKAITRRLCEASRIPHAVNRATDMIKDVDAVILARDDYEKHWRMAEPFLKAGLPVFIDKPLSLKTLEIKKFTPFLKKGQLMSCSSMRYAVELENFKKNSSSYGKLILVRGAVLNSWEKYGIHLLEGIFSAVRVKPSSVTALEAQHESVVINTQGGPLIQIDTLGNKARAFNIEFYGEKQNSSHVISDNFSMFKKTIAEFIRLVKTGKPVIEASETLELMRILAAGRMALAKNRKVSLREAGF